MLFSSISFLVFFLPIVLLLTYCFRSNKKKNIVLLISSLLFYSWGEPKYILVMLGSILVNYFAGILIGKESIETKYKKLILTITIILNLGVLFIFKYLGFSCSIINSILTHLSLSPLPIINFIMPIGISFYTFQSISYIVDVYRDNSLCQKNICSLALYISFFPQLVAGPIVRYSDINIAINDRTVTIDSFAKGIERFIIGLSKKVLLANNLAYIADGIYTTEFFSYSTYYAWIAAISYALQIYFDFSGYSDMAIGLGKLFGFNFPENFNFPYISKSITEFWRRWHISLSSWFKDYLYIPLGGNRKGKVRTYVNLFIVFFCTGLWHGADFAFIFWGLGHGCLNIIEKIVKKHVHIKSNKIINFFLHIYTLLAVTLLWVFFRNDIQTSIKLILKMFSINFTKYTNHFTPFVNTFQLSILCNTKAYIIILISIFLSFPWWKKINLSSCNKYLTSTISILKKVLLLVLFVFCYSSLASSAYNPFIYFRF